MSVELALVNEAPPPAPVVTDANPMLGMIERIMTDPNISVDRVNMAFDFYQKVNADTARKAFDAAMAAAKAEIGPIVKNRLVSHETKTGGTKSYRHEDLAGIARVIDPILGKHGLSYRYRTTSVPNEPVAVTCIVSHRLGHSEENTLYAGRDDSGNKNSIQAIGSTITYLQRYTLKAAFGLAAAHDDDGKAAGSTDAPLTQADIDGLVSLIAETNSNLDLVLTAAKARPFEDGEDPSFADKVARLSEIGRADFDRVRARLLQKKGK